MISTDESVTLADGSAAVVRLLTDQDRPAVHALFDSVSDGHLYTRFFTLGRAMIDRHLDLLFAGGPDVTTYVMDVAGRAVGVCEAIRLSPSTSEVAFLVADDVHGRGVATLLLERAARDAQVAGIAWFTADVLAVNHEMIQVFTDVGFTVELLPEGSDVAVRMSTALSDAWRAAQRSRR